MCIVNAASHLVDQLFQPNLHLRLSPVLNYAEKRLDIYAVAFADAGAVHWQDNKTVGLGHGT